MSYTPEPPTELDKLREGYVNQILQHVNDPLNEDGGRYMVDYLLQEWGAKAYFQGREHMAARIKKCADEWVRATT
jgi:hypothetical protein